MSFEAVFDPRWINVIQPGIRDAGLEPYRVDMPPVSTSITADIVTGICRSRLILADITATSGQRNGNVMYEVGIAHALRQSEEVILFRSDHNDLLFDVSSVRVHDYSPDTDPAAARTKIAAMVSSAAREVDTLKSLAVERVSSELDPVSFGMLIAVFYPVEGYAHPVSSLVNSPVVASLMRLLELGLIETTWLKASHEEIEASKAARKLVTEVARQFARYRVTPFGHAVISATSNRLGVTVRQKSASDRTETP